MHLLPEKLLTCSSNYDVVVAKASYSLAGKVGSQIAAVSFHKYERTRNEDENSAAFVVCVFGIAPQIYSAEKRES